MNVDAILALLGELFAQVQFLTARLNETERQRDELATELATIRMAEMTKEQESPE